MIERTRFAPTSVAAIPAYKSPKVLSGNRTLPLIKSIIASLIFPSDFILINGKCNPS